MDIRLNYSLERDIGNYVNALYRFKWLKHGRGDIQEKLLAPFPKPFKHHLEKAKNENQARQVSAVLLEKSYTERKRRFSKVAKKLEYAWQKEGSKIEKKLQDVFTKKIPFKKINFYLTSLPICPYNYKERWIMIFANIPTERQLQILTHELNHFMFYYYFGNLESELSKEKFESLKEALTVFTNPEEKGYPAQQKLRAWLVKEEGTIPEIIKKNGWRKFL